MSDNGGSFIVASTNFHGAHLPMGQVAQPAAKERGFGAGFHTMKLSPIFLAGVPSARRAAFGAMPELEEALAGLIAAGRAAWPAIPLKEADFAAFLGGVIGPEIAPDIVSLCAGDLHLACAYGLGAPGAAAALDERCMSRVESTLTRLGTPAPMRDDIKQDLRARLLELRSPSPDRKSYSGRGALASWLCVTAVREANRRRERSRKDLPLHPSDTLLLCSVDDDPEIAYLHSVYKQELNDAFRSAFAELSSRDRNILRYHLIDGLSIDHLGVHYGVHRATAARWINRACETLRLRTRELFSQRVSLSQEGFHRILFLIESQIKVELTKIPA